MIDAMIKVARALGGMNEQVVFVGGAVAGLYAGDPGAPEVRPTKDIDIVFQIASVLELEKLRQSLTERGIHAAIDENVMCRFRYRGILIDVMSTKEVGWAPANPWFQAGFDHPEIVPLEDVQIQILPVAYYVASKFVAFKERGEDPRISHDFEDIVYVLDNRTTVVEDIMRSEEDVRVYLMAELTSMLNEESLQEAILGHLEPATQASRYEMLRMKLQEIVM